MLSPRYATLPFLLLGGGCAPAEDTGLTTNGLQFGLGAPLSPRHGPSVDIVVVGGGPAGLMAAVHAHQAGAEVLLLERNAKLGGVAPSTSGLIMLAGSDAQAAEGHQDSATILLDDWEASTGRRADDPWVRQYAERAIPDVHDWYLEQGVDFALAGDAADQIGTIPRLHLPTSSGEGLVLPLEALLPEERAWLEHEVQGLLLEDGQVAGVRYLDPEGHPRSIRAHAVVMATGAFMRDLELVHGNRPELEEVELAWACSHGADGAGHRWLLELGATWDKPTAVSLYLHGTPDPRVGSAGEELLVTQRSKGIHVNASGLRFHDENDTNSLATAEQALASGEPPFWFVLDTPLASQVMFADTMVAEGEEGEVTHDMLAEAGTRLEADTLAALAEAMGVNGEQLADEVKAFNAFTRGEAEDAWRDDEIPPPAIDEPPFVAIRLIPALAKAFTGIEVDLGGRVLDAHGDPIPGLYAAGELTGMAGGSLVDHTGFNGSFSAVLLSGRVAGETAAGDLEAP